MGNRFERFCVWFSGIIFGAIVAYLFGMSIFYTCFVNSSEVTYYIVDKPLVQIVCILLFVAALVFIRKKWGFEVSEKVFKIYAGTITVCAVIFVIATQYAPTADQEYILTSAHQLLQGNYYPWEPGGYIYTYSYQNGIVLFMAVLSLVFGGYNYVAFQLLNVAALVGCFYYMYKICLYLFQEKHINRLIVMALFSFVPFVLYVTFVYGTIIGLMLSMLALYLEYKYFETGKIRYAVWGAVVIALAVILKMNYMIFMAAYGIMMFVDIFTNERKKSIAGLILLLAVYFAGDFAVIKVTEGIIGQDMPTGTPMLSSVAMGLQEGYLAPGWNNDYDYVSYKDSGYNVDSVKYFSKIHISNAINKFREDSAFANSFFARKISSQWINPTFECFWIQNSREHTTEDAGWITSLTDTGGILNKIALRVFNIVQSIIYFGAFLYVLLGLKKARINELVFAIITIGGFLFYIVWEGKCQYTIPYFVMIIPYAVLGYDMLTKRLAGLEIGTLKAGIKPQAGLYQGICIALMGLFMAWYGVYMMSFVKLSDDLYYQYNVKMNIHNRFEQGEYYIAPYDNADYAVTAQVGDSETTVYLAQNDELDNQKINICSYEDKYVLWYAHSHKYLRVLEDLSDYTFVVETEYKEMDNIQWVIEANTLGEGYYIKTKTGLYLQYDIGTGLVTVGVYTGDSSQLWNINSVNNQEE